MNSPQRLTATVVHALWKQSPQVFVESFRILHDLDPADALFETETELRLIEILDQPRLGPLSIYRKQLAIPVDAALRYFAGNSSPYVTRVDLDLALQPPEPEPGSARTSAGGVSAWNGISGALRHNRFSHAAPKNIAADDVLWNPDNPLSWFGVRSLQWEASGIVECLDVVVLKFVYLPSQDRSWEIVDALGLSSPIAVEYQQALVNLNNANIFQVRRRSRLSDVDYIARYV